MSDSSEKRRSERRRILFPMLYWETAGEPRTGPGIQTTTKDVSETGVAFQTSTLYPIDSILTAEILIPGRKEPVSTKLKINRVESAVGKDKYLVGTSFEGLGLEMRGLIAESLDRMNLFSVLEAARAMKASDIHLTVGRPPFFRVGGKIRVMDAPPLEEGQVKAMLFPLINDAQAAYFDKYKELDFAFSPNVHSRFRVNVHQQKGYLEAALRSIPASIKKLDDLGLPVEQLEKLCQEKSGLILIAGKTTSGKTTTMTAMIDYINHNLERVVIMIEDPIEYIHASDKSIIKQRELGSDTDSYGEALKHSLRQDPDIIVVGELLDGESLISALRAAESGHLVISTIHAPDTVQALERVVSLMPAEHAPGAAQQLAFSLVGVLYQTLLPGRLGELVVATELLINNSGVRNTIRDGKFAQVRSYIQTGLSQGMYTLDSQVKSLCERGLIEPAVMNAALKH